MIFDRIGPRSRRAAAALCVLLCAGTASAQAPDETQRRAVAQALFDEATKLMDSGNYSVACIKLEEVVRLQPGKIGAILTLARCYEGEGKIASAWSRYKNVADAAKVAGDARLAEADKKISALEKRLPKIAINVPETTGAIVGLSVKRDGLDVSPAQWGVSIPVDPGEHSVEVSAPGRKAWASDATLVEGRTTTVTVPDLERDVPAAPTVTATVAPRPVVIVPVRPSSDASKPAPRRAVLGLEAKTWGKILFGVGMAGVVAGAVTGGVAVGMHDSLDKACPDKRCPAGKQGDVNAYEAVGTVSTVGLIAGGVFAVAGAIVWAVSPKPAAARVRVLPYASPTGFGVVGSF